MSIPFGEGAQGDVDFDALLNTATPTFELIDPKTAPADMLDSVRVNTRGRCLEADTAVGAIAVELYWKTDDSPDGAVIQGDFCTALTSGVDPDAKTNPTATQRHPYTILPDGALYGVVVRAPADAVSTEWSPERTIAIGGDSKLLGMNLTEFRRAYPGVEVDLPDGQYTITATERTQQTLVIAARVENGEPLTRIQEVSGSAVRYKETLIGDFTPSVLRPDTVVAAVNSRTTIRDDGKNADCQQLQFKTHDGFERTGEGAAENSGIVELIVMQAEAAEFTGFTFTPYQSPIQLRPGYSSFADNFGDHNLSYAPAYKEPGAGGLAAGETRYRPPEIIKVSMTGIRDYRAIAAFRFAMAGRHNI